MTVNIVSPPAVKFRFSVNPHGRDKTWDFETLASRFEDSEGTIRDVQRHVKAGHALCAGLLDGARRSKAGVSASQWILLDVDNSKVRLDNDGKPVKDLDGHVVKDYHSQLTLGDALQHPFIAEHCSLIYTTASHTEDWPKYRLVFLLPELVEDLDEYEGMVRHLMDQLPHDPACKDASRVFYGSTKASFPLVQPSVTLPQSWIAAAREAAKFLKAQREKQIKEADEKRRRFQETAKAEGWDTDQLIMLALSHIPGRAPGSGNYDECRRVLMALVDHYGPSQAEMLAEQWSPSIKGTTWNIPRKIRSFRRDGVSIATLFYIAKEHGFRFPERQKVKDRLSPAQKVQEGDYLHPNDEIPQEGEETPEELAKALKEHIERIASVDRTTFDSWYDEQAELLSTMRRFRGLRTTAVIGQVEAVRRRSDSTGLVNSSDLLIDTLNDIEQRSQGMVLPGVPCGFIDIDAMTQGFQRSDLIVVAARPSMGKTAWSIEVGKNIAKNQNLPVAVFSLEMGKQQLIHRLISSEAGIPTSRLRAGKIHPHEWPILAQAIETISNAPLAIDDDPCPSVGDIRGKCRKLQDEAGSPLGAVLIDYLQLMVTGDNEVQELTRLTRELKLLARELNAPVIILSQLSRGVEQRTNKRPYMSDLRSSGSIEQDADLIMMLYREEYYDPDTADKGITEINIVKHRNGPTGTIKLLFEPQFTRFRNLAA